MASEAIRDPVKDILLTPKNSAFVIIDYQPVQVNSIASMDRQLLINNIVGACKAAVAYGLPIVHSTVNVKTGLNKPPIPQVRKALEGIPTYDRTSINSWEDVEFRAAVKETGRSLLRRQALCPPPAIERGPPGRCPGRSGPAPAWQARCVDGLISRLGTARAC